MRGDNSVEKVPNLENRAQRAYFLSNFEVGQILKLLSPTGC